MLFSATLDNAVNVLVRRFLNEPARHASDSAAPPAQISRHLLTVSPDDRLAVVRALAGGRNRALVFTRTKHGARKLARQQRPGPAPCRSQALARWLQEAAATEPQPIRPVP
jgi:superfamily II DNA/RNA helicase